MKKGVRNGSGAFAALLTAGGLWAWRNRDRIQGWMNNQRNRSSSAVPMTGETHRLAQDEYLGPDRKHDAPRNFDASI
jgi:hypothetical protein